MKVQIKPIFTTFFYCSLMKSFWVFLIFIAHQMIISNFRVWNFLFWMFTSLAEEKNSKFALSSEENTSDLVLITIKTKFFFNSIRQSPPPLSTALADCFFSPWKWKVTTCEEGKCKQREKRRKKSTKSRRRMLSCERAREWKTFSYSHEFSDRSLGFGDCRVWKSEIQSVLCFWIFYWFQIDWKIGQTTAAARSAPADQFV